MRKNNWKVVLCNRYKIKRSVWKRPWKQRIQILKCRKNCNVSGTYNNGAKAHDLGKRKDKVILKRDKGIPGFLGL